MNLTMIRPIKYRVREIHSHEVIGYETLIDGQWRYRIEGSHWMIGVFTLPGLIREQSTGLQDRNGFEVYAGDILEWKRKRHDLDPTHRAVVFWDEMKSGFYLAPVHMYPWSHGSIRGEHLNAKNKVIIGDVHRNPELLNPTNGTL